MRVLARARARRHRAGGGRRRATGAGRSATRRDAITPYSQAVDVADTLAHGRLLTLDAAGHTALGRSDCIDAAEAAYYVDLTLPRQGTVCSP